MKNKILRFLFEPLSEFNEIFFSEFLLILGAVLIGGSIINVKGSPIWQLSIGMLFVYFASMIKHNSKKK